MKITTPFALLILAACDPSQPTIDGGEMTDGSTVADATLPDGSTHPDATIPQEDGATPADSGVSPGPATNYGFVSVTRVAGQTFISGAFSQVTTPATACPMTTVGSCAHLECAGGGAGQQRSVSAGRLTVAVDGEAMDIPFTATYYSLLQAGPAPAVDAIIRVAAEGAEAPAFTMEGRTLGRLQWTSPTLPSLPTKLVVVRGQPLSVVWSAQGTRGNVVLTLQSATTAGQASISNCEWPASAGEGTMPIEFVNAVRELGNSTIALSYRNQTTSNVQDWQMTLNVVGEVTTASGVATGLIEFR